MFKVKSLHPRGTTVEIVQKGRIVNRRIRGLGVVFSEKRTSDMVNQQSAGFVKIEQPGAPVQEEAPATPPQDPPNDPVDTMMSEADLNKLTKAELLDLAEEHEIDLEGSTKADYVECLSKYDIPKE